MNKLKAFKDELIKIGDFRYSDLSQMYKRPTSAPTTSPSIPKGVEEEESENEPQDITHGSGEPRSYD